MTMTKARRHAPRLLAGRLRASRADGRRSRRPSGARPRAACRAAWSRCRRGRASPAASAGRSRPASRWVANVWRSVCGLIALAEPRGARVALDDLVEALARQAAAAVVDEQPRLVAVADELRAAAAEVGADARAVAARADRHEPLLGALAAGAQDAGLEVDVADLEVDRLGGAQAAGVHQLEQRAVAQRGRLGAPGWASSRATSSRREHLREPPALARGAQLRRSGRRSIRPSRRRWR